MKSVALKLRKTTWTLTLKNSFYLIAVFLILSGGLFVVKNHFSHSHICETHTVSTQEDSFSYTTHTYTPMSPSNKTIIILPPTGGVTLLERRYAAQLCQQKFNAIILAQWSGDNEHSLDLDIHQRLYDRAQRALKLLIDSLDSTYIGLLGTSVGGIHASMAITHINRINSVFTIAAGAPVASIIVHSDQKVLAKAKRARMKQFDFRSEVDYEKALQQHIFWDIFNPQVPIENKSFGMIIATKDMTVPTPYQIKLKEFWQPSTVIQIPYGHISGILWSSFFYNKEILSFFVTDAENALTAKIF